MKRDIKFYLKLFISTFTLSAFTFGGGFVIVSLMKKKFVDKFGWLTDEEMLDLTAIAQSTPGSIAVNASVLIGYRVAGIPGALVSVLATVLPPLIILSVVSVFYLRFKSSLLVAKVLKGMQAGVAAIICDVVVSMGSEIFKSKKIIPILLLFIAFVAVAVFKVNVIYVILVCGVVGALSSIKRGEEHK